MINIWFWFSGVTVLPNGRNPTVLLVTDFVVCAMVTISSVSFYLEKGLLSHPISNGM